MVNTILYFGKLKLIINYETNKYTNSCFCEEWLNISFEGNIEDRQQVSIFLSKYLDDAKNTYEEIVCEYEAYLWELD